jgi:outer membrane biosynthesis protein TonB
VNYRHATRRLFAFTVSLVAISLLSSPAETEPIQENRAVTLSPQVSPTDKPEVTKVGKDVSPPVLIHWTNPEVPEIARREKVTGVVVVNIYIEPDGTPSNVHIIQTKLTGEKGPRGPGYIAAVKELEDNAISQVQTYRFKPAKKNGKPVRVELNVSVNFGG